MIIKIIINIKNTILKKKEVNNREEESHRTWSEITGMPSNLRLSVPQFPPLHRRDSSNTIL